MGIPDLPDDETIEEFFAIGTAEDVATEILAEYDYLIVETPETRLLR